MARKKITITNYQTNKAFNAIGVNGDGEKNATKNVEYYNKSDDATSEKNEDKTSIKDKIESENLSFFTLFRYSTILERILVVIGIFLASIGAIGIPFATVIYGEFTSLLIDRTTGIGTSTPTLVLKLFGGGQILTDATWDVNREALIKDAEAFGIASLVGAFFEWIVLAIGIYLLNLVAEAQIKRIRLLFLDSILRQDMAWFDTSSGGNFANKMTEDLEKLREGLGEKLAIFSFLVMTFVFSIVASFFYGWKLTLVVLTCCPVIIISTALVAKIQSSLTEKELKSYSIAGAVAEEVFSGIRTVVAFSGENKEIERYSTRLEPAQSTGFKKGLYSGLGGGVMWFIIYCCYAIALWYGVKLILDDRDKEYREYTPAVLVIVLFGVILGAQNLGFSSPHVEAFSTARASAKTIFATIDRKSPIDPMDDIGLKPTSLAGDISFENIYFHYPARTDVEILQGLSLTIEHGQTVAFVGPSGCGKSTCLQLLQRMYNPLEGQIKLDGVDISQLNLAWLRSQIGVVGQEPILFATTIGENIRYGKPSATQEEIESAAKMANCHYFILKQPQGYNTMVGERGSQMSGGQKQRIAIARALIRNPKILLLDEATSALDPTSERRVQKALDLASVGRTTLVVSHRLSTITNADKIVYIENGIIGEQGTHNELMEKKGLYWQLVNINKRKEKAEQLTSPIKRQRLLSEMSSTSGDENPNNQADMQKFDELNVKYKVTWKQLLKLVAPEWKFLLIGSIAAILHGATYPAWAIIFGDFYGVLGNADVEYISNEASIFSYIFIGIGLIAGLGTLVQTYMFNKAGVLLTSRLRRTAFKTIVSQEIGWFDDEKNSVGALCARLAGDCSGVQGATGSRIGIIVQSVATLSIGVILSLIYSWNLALVTLVTIPIVLASVFLESRYMSASAMDEKIAIENASQVAVEAIANIRTVNSLGQESYVLERYQTEIEKVRLSCRKKTRFRGIVFGMGQSSPFLAYGVSLYYGGLLVANEGLPYENVIKVTEALIFGSWMLGQALAYAPNVSAAMISTGRLLKLFERVPKYTNPSAKPFNGAEKADGDIEFQDVEFTYPTRPDVPVLQGLNLKIDKGTTVALVGPSGCGKSTCVQLLLRYYDPESGEIKLRDTPTTNFPFDTLRSQLGLVSQEPVLFDRTIAENIAYGNNFIDVPMAEIIEAAKNANIHSFVMSLPNGYDTSLGNRGAQLSGGQKQRIAIARALVRNPKILILDEATSALDIHSEKVVQDALDAARAGRTCITIAHRLTTIQNADLICVIKAGVVHEQGTHSELIKLNGIYADLSAMQQVE